MTAPTHSCPPDLGDLVVLLLAGTLAGLRDRLIEDGFDGAGELVGDLVEMADLYLSQHGAHSESWGR